MQYLELPKNSFGVTTPLRYPGGKSAIAGFLAEVINKSKDNINRYVEPYAGGAGAAISLLINNKVDSVVINDLDPAVYSFWMAITRQPDRFVDKIMSTEITIKEWYRQRDIYREHDLRSKFNLGFAFFFLNRCNHSGIIKGGVIGGYSQRGTYKLDARYKKDKLIKKIRAIKRVSEHIEVTNKDGNEVFDQYVNDSRTLIYLDPPYVEQGSSLYLNAFSNQDHKNLANSVSPKVESNWIVTYDKSELIASDCCYSNNHIYSFSLTYSAQNKRKESEYLICSDKLNGAISNYAIH